jgi:hypothetical protein
MFNPKYLCASCATAADCKQAFGKFWRDRSRGGVGCNVPFAYIRLRDIATGNLPPSPKKSIQQRNLI